MKFLEFVRFFLSWARNTVFLSLHNCKRKKVSYSPVYLQSWTKVLTHLSKTNAFHRRPSVTSKSIFFVDNQPPSPPFQCCNTLRGHFHLVTTLKRGEGVEKSKLDIENSLVERNGSFSESVSTTFVYDCLNYILHILKLSQYHHCSSTQRYLASLFSKL